MACNMIETLYYKYIEIPIDIKFFGPENTAELASTILIKAMAKLYFQKSKIITHLVVN